MGDVNFERRMFEVWRWLVSFFACALDSNRAETFCLGEGDGPGLERTLILGISAAET
jgi:hypothetical protein